MDIKVDLMLNIFVPRASSELGKKRAGEKPAADKEQLAVTLRLIGDGVITTDREQRVTLMNPVAENYTGWTGEEARGRPVLEVFNVVNENRRQWQLNTVTGMAEDSVLVSKNGTKRLIEANCAPMHDLNNEPAGVMLVFRDITERRRLERELVKARKFESMGMLAGGIAHDFNNLLMGIIGSISVAKMKMEGKGGTYNLLSNAEKAAIRGRNLIRQLLTFAEGGATVKETVCIAELIRDTISFTLRGSASICELEIDEDLYRVDIDEGQIGRVINNLVINADQAMPDGGLIKVRVRNVTVEDDNPMSIDGGNYIRISVEDNGVGIPEKNLTRIFDPFFTTRPNGSGLGLPASYAIVRSHNGAISVDSRLGRGSAFHVYLRASDSSLMTVEREEEIVGGTGG
jgi:PAS domain S-box-containing protein